MFSPAKIALAGVSLLAVMTPTAYAQEASEDSGYSAVGDIVVTARRRDESVQDVPAVINAVTADAVANLNIRDFKDISAVVPGLSLAGNANGIGSVSTVRGVNYNVVTSGNNGTIQFYMNDAPVDTGSLFQAMFDIGQVEVQRGPQGTLRGRASPSGSINVTFKRPDLGEVGGYVQGTATSLSGYNLNGAINIPLIQDKLAIRLAGLLSEDEGSRVTPLKRAGSLLPDTKPYNDSRALRFSVAADPFDGILKLDFMYQNTDRKMLAHRQVQSLADFGDLPLGVTVPASSIISPKDRHGLDIQPSYVRQKIESFNWQAQLALAGQRLVYIGHHQKGDINSFEPGDLAGIFAGQSGPLYVTPGVGIGQPIGPVQDTIFAQENRSVNKSTSHEIRLQNDARLWGMVDYVVGYMHYDLNSPTTYDRVFGAYSANGQTIDGIVKYPAQRFNKMNEQSVFGSLTVHITPRTELSGGVRRIWFKQDSGQLQLPFGASFDYPTYGEGLTFLTPGMEEHQKKTTNIYTAALKHRFTDNIMAYASFGTSWRPGRAVVGTRTLAVGPGVTQAQADSWNRWVNTADRDETSQSYEVGLRTDWLNRRVMFNISGYIQKYKGYGYAMDEVYTLRNGSINKDRFTAIVPVEVKGVEAELTLRPLNNWSINASVNYADGKIQNGEIPCTQRGADGAPVLGATPTVNDTVDVCNFSGRSANSSPWSGTFQSEYFHAVSPFTDAYLRGLLSWQGNSIGDPTNPYDSVKGYGLLNLYAGLRSNDGAWDIQLYAKNITNTFRVLNRTGRALNSSVSSTIGGSSFDSAYGNYYHGITVTEPREFGVSLRYAFGSR